MPRPVDLHLDKAKLHLEGCFSLSEKKVRDGLVVQTYRSCIDQKADRLIRKTCRLLLALAQKQRIVTTESLVEAAQLLISKPIRLRPVDFSGTGTFGMWLALPEANIILFEESTSPAHQAHIILHELGHIILGHCGISVRNEDQNAAGLLRQGVIDSQETQAEMFAIRMTRLLQIEAKKLSSARDSCVASRIANTLTGGHWLGGF